MQPNIVVIEVNGGIPHYRSSNIPVSLVFIDHDTDGIDPENITTFEGERVNVWGEDSPESSAYLGIQDAEEVFAFAEEWWGRD
jgi:hypothetical protein